MNWTSTAILSAATMGIVSIIDSHLLSRRMPSFRAYMLLMGTVHLGYGLLLFYLFPLPEGIGIWPILVTLVAGTLRAAAVSIMLYSLTREDVSRVVPVVYSCPIFVAIMAIPLLGETLSYLEWLAIIIVVTGAVIISTEKSPTASTNRLGKLFLLLFVSSLFFAAADIATKYVLAYVSFWNVFSLSAFCLSGISLLVSMRPVIFRQIKEMKQRDSSIALLAFNETLAPIGVVLAFRSMGRGPISLVSTIIGSRPAFVALYALILGYLFPRFLIRTASRGMLALRLAATAMIVGGISIIYLT